MYQKIIYLLFLLATFCNGLRYKRDYNYLYNNLNVEDRYFTQQLDHFDNANKNTWRQRYFENENFYENGGPIFVMIEGESEARVDWDADEPWLVWARQFQAQCYVLEHRYYGQSQPTEDLSVENLQYLSTEQALADIANFQLQMIANNSNLGGLTKWIYFGGSYAGMLVAWFRLKFPHLAYAGVASSATVLIDVESSEYLRLVYEAIYNHDPVCSQAIANALSQIQSYIDGDDSDRTFLSEFLSFCDPYASYEAKQVATIYYQINLHLSSIVQYNSYGPSIEEMCNIMMDPLSSELRNLATLITSPFSCFSNSYTTFVQNLQEIYSYNGDRQWIYQMCTELGGFTTTSKLKQTSQSTVSLKFFTDFCADIFDSHFNEKLVSFGVDQSNTNYGGKNISLTRVIFLNGSLDPWRYLGILQDISNEAKAVYIQGTSHCEDMKAISYLDSPELVDAREIVRQQIHLWVYEY